MIIPNYSKKRMKRSHKESKKRMTILKGFTYEK